LSYKPYKKEFPYSYTLGVFPTIELLESGRYETEKVVLHSAGSENQGIVKIIELCRIRGIPAETNDKLVNKLSTKENCYAVGIFHKREVTLEAPENHIVLVHPGDMGNLGTIIRTAVGFGIRNIAVIRPGVDAYDPKVVRGSMGSFFRANVQYFESFQAYQDAFADHSIYTFRLNAAVPLQRVEPNPQKPFALVFGNESSGLSAEFDAIGTGVVIPHRSDIDSLNLSIAVGIAAYHFTKERF